jgi:hypothetical protein
MSNIKNKRKRVAVEDQETVEDIEFQRELAAVEQIQREKVYEGQKKRKNNSDEKISHINEEESISNEEAGNQKKPYNREALMKCIQDWETLSLPFMETMKIDCFPIEVENELDDLQREVRLL